MEMCSSDDPFTTAMRLCDDDGMVSDQPIDAPAEPAWPTGRPDRTYLDRLNRLRNVSRVARGDKPEELAVAFECTGHAHLAGAHIECTSHAHQQAADGQWMTFDGAPLLTVPGDASPFAKPFIVVGGQPVAMERPAGVLFPRPPGAPAITATA